jgi:hypothetical protein
VSPGRPQGTSAFGTFSTRCQGHRPHHTALAHVLQVLTGIINATDIPFTTYVAHPRSPLHYVDARLKQLWLLALLILIPRLPWQARVFVVASVIVLALVCLPERLSKAQLARLLPLSTLLATITALTADQVRSVRYYSGALAFSCSVHPCGRQQVHKCYNLLAVTSGTQAPHMRSSPATYLS